MIENPFKKSKDWSKSANAMAAVERCIKAGTVKVNINTYEARISRAIHWDNMDRKWRKNFVTNLKTYIDLRRVINKAEITSDKILVFDIEGGDFLVEQIVKND